jgi:hypothetical protein
VIDIKVVVNSVVNDQVFTKPVILKSLLVREMLDSSGLANHFTIILKGVQAKSVAAFSTHEFPSLDSIYHSSQFHLAYNVILSSIVVLKS